MIFLTVGTSFPFDRLVRAVDDLVGKGELKDPVFAQVGENGYHPRYCEWVETLAKEKFDSHLAKATAIVSHAGVGTITMALDQNKPILVLPRLKEFNELVNDHQLATARRFEQLGHILVAYHTDDLATKLQMLATFQPVPRKNQAKQVAERIALFLNTLLHSM